MTEWALSSLQTLRWFTLNVVEIVTVSWNSLALHRRRNSPPSLHSPTVHTTPHLTSDKPYEKRSWGSSWAANICITSETVSLKFEKYFMTNCTKYEIWIFTSELTCFFIGCRKIISHHFPLANLTKDDHERKPRKKCMLRIGQPWINPVPISKKYSSLV